MSTINPGNNIEFKSTDSIFANIKRRLKSYDNAGILDEGDWYVHVKDMLDRLGVSVYEEKEAVLIVKNFKAPLPDNFSYLYAAYKCTPNASDSKNTLFPQTGFVFYLEETHEPYRQCKNCSFAKRDFIDGEKVTIRTYIEGQPMILNFNSLVLLQLSGNVKGICDDKCKNLFQKAAWQITIDKGFLYTNFENDSVYMKYYALPLDPSSGLPLIPNVSFIENAIEDYIIYKEFQNFWYNNSVPEMENRYRDAEIKFNNSLGQALYYCKLPSFQSAINKIRFDRKNLRIYQQAG